MITGATRGIGSAIAKRFAAQGALVVINYALRKEDAERTMAAIQAKGGAVITFQADITKASAVEQLFTAANERHSQICSDLSGITLRRFFVHRHGWRSQEAMLPSMRSFW